MSIGEQRYWLRVVTAETWTGLPLIPLGPAGLPAHLSRAAILSGATRWDFPLLGLRFDL